MYIYGGFIDGEKTSSIYKYSFIENHWEIVEPLPPSAHPSPRSSHSAVIMDSQMIIFGGKDEDNEKLNDTWCFDLTSL